jgi:serine/threonine protein kinase
MADRVGQHIDDYRLIRLLGTGSFGEVYLGEHLDDRTLVAVKMLSLNQENWREFVKEVGTTFRLKHPHIIALLAFGMSAEPAVANGVVYVGSEDGKLYAFGITS